MSKRLIQYSFILAAGLIYAIALKYFVLPSEVILTGTEGIASALSYYFETYWLFILLYALFQILLLSFAFLRVSRIFALRSSVVVATVIIALLLLPELQFAQPESQNERIILVIFGGLLAGVAKALALQNRGSTGDEDILAAYFAMKTLKPVGVIAIFAAIISTTFGLALDLLKNGAFESVVNTLMYTCVYIFITAETLNNLYRKFKITMLVVVTTEAELIGEAITQLYPHRTYSIQESVGGFSSESYKMVKTIITHEELAQALEKIQAADAKCFYYYHDVEGVSRNYYIQPIG